MKTIVILGMHRSSTSLIARGLSSECYTGSPEHLIPPAFDNPKGFFEDRRVVILNDQILHYLGNYTWDNPPPKKLIQDAKNISRISTYIQNVINTLHSEADGKTVVIKDPRMCLLIDLWDPYLPNPQYIMSWRNPEDIAKSLHKRSLVTPPIKSMDEWKDLTMEYNKRAQEFINKKFNI